MKPFQAFNESTSSQHNSKLHLKPFHGTTKLHTPSTVPHDRPILFHNTCEQILLLHSRFSEAEDYFLTGYFLLQEHSDKPSGDMFSPYEQDFQDDRFYFSQFRLQSWAKELRLCQTVLSSFDSETNISEFSMALIVRFFCFNSHFYLFHPCSYVHD